MEAYLDNFTKNFNILTRAFLMVYYFAENLSLLKNLKFLNRKYSVFIELTKGLSFLVAQLSHFTYYLIVLKRTFDDEENLKKLDLKKYKVKDIFQKIQILSTIRKYIYLGIIRLLGDILIAFYDLKLFENFLGTNFAKLLIGIGGFLSSLISIYQLFYGGPYLK